jgi:predicted PurR-regulated permease PerM
MAMFSHTHPPALDRSPPHPEEGWFSRERLLILVLIAATALAIYLCYLLALPFLPALAWALALAVVGHPLHRWLAERLRNPNLAAGLAVLLVVVILLVPAFFVVSELVREAAAGVERVQQDGAAGRWRNTVLQNPRLAPLLEWIDRHQDVVGELQRTLAARLQDLTGLVSGSVWAVVQMLVALFVLFYFFRDRRTVLRGLRSLLPLSDAEVDQVFARAADTIHATVYGRLVVAGIQGALGGLMFWWLGLPAPVLWGVVMALLSVVPYLGSFIIWGPAAVYLALEGSWASAILLTAWGVVVVGLIDNLLYPVLVGGRLRMHTLTTFIAILGGLTVFGTAGIILGPLIVAISAALVEVWRRRTEGGRPAEEGVKD